MLRAIRKLFGQPQSSSDVDAFVRDLGNADVFVIAATRSEGIDANKLTKDNLLAAIREAMERDQEDQKNGYSLFVYVENGQRRLPFFTSNDHAQTFCGEYSKQRDRVFPFMLLGVKGSFLGKSTAEMCDVVVMNDKSPDERALSADEVAAARRMWGLR